MGSAYIKGPIDSSFLVANAIRRIKKDYGVDVSVREKGKSLVKFGRNTAVDTEANGGSTIL